MLEDVYLELNKCHLCHSGYQFSEEYLGRSKSYYGVLKAKQIEPSVYVLLKLLLVLRGKAESLTDTKSQTIVNARQRLLSLCDDVNDELLESIDYS